MMPLPSPPNLASASYDLDLQICKVDNFTPSAHRPLVPIGIKTGLFILDILCSQVWKETNGQVENMMQDRPASQVWQRQTSVKDPISISLHK